MTIFGPILLLIERALAIWRNRKETKPGDDARSDRTAKALREELDREDKRREERSRP